MLPRQTQTPASSRLTLAVPPPPILRSVQTVRVGREGHLEHHGPAPTPRGRERSRQPSLLLLQGLARHLGDVRLPVHHVALADAPRLLHEQRGERLVAERLRATRVPLVRPSPLTTHPRGCPPPAPPPALPRPASRLAPPLSLLLRPPGAASPSAPSPSSSPPRASWPRAARTR